MGTPRKRWQRRTVYRGLGVALLLLAAAGGAREGRAQDAAAVKQQVDEVVREGLTYAKTQIAQEFSFLPFAVIRHTDGRIERILGPTGDELDPLDTPELQADPALALAQLQRRVQQQAKARGDFQVVGIFSDADVKLPDGADSDAIQAEMEHASGYCADVFLPYGRVVNTLTWGDEIRTKGDGLVFHCKPAASDRVPPPGSD